MVTQVNRDGLENLGSQDLQVYLVIVDGPGTAVFRVIRV